jgi:hypothetical protein
MEEMQQWGWLWLMKYLAFPNFNFSERGRGFLLDTP